MEREHAVGRGRPRLVNQAVLDEMITLRRQGYSLPEIAGKVHRSERTVRRYVHGIVPRLERTRAGNGADTVAWCHEQLFRQRERLELTIEQVDSVIRQLRERISGFDPLTLEAFSASEELRSAYFWGEFVPSVLASHLGRLEVDRVAARLGVVSGW